MRDIKQIFFQDDFFLLSEMVHDYIGIVGAVKDVLAERIKAWQAWQGVQVSPSSRSMTFRYRYLPGFVFFRFSDLKADFVRFGSSNH